MKLKLLYATLALALGLAIPTLAFAGGRHHHHHCPQPPPGAGHPTGDPCPPVTVTITTPITTTVTTPTQTVTGPTGPAGPPGATGTTTTITILKFVKPKPCHTVLGLEVLGPLPTRFNAVKRVSVQAFGHRKTHSTYVGAHGHRYTKLNVRGLACGVYPMTINDVPDTHAVQAVLRIWVIRHHSLTRVGWPDWPTAIGLS